MTYLGLRDYGLPPLVWGGDTSCAHEWDGQRRMLHTGSSASDKALSNRGVFHGDKATSDAFCSKCGAFRGSLGLESTIDAYVAHLVEVFREVKRVLHPSGVLLLNLGDSYSGAGDRRGGKGDEHGQGKKWTTGVPAGLKPKDLMEIPSEVVRALRADGWWLRSRIPWVKSAGMPESCEDRPGSAVEYWFLLSKSERYYWDGLAVARKGRSFPVSPRRTSGTPLGAAVRSSELDTTLLTDDGMTRTVGWCNLGSSKFAIHNPMAGSAEGGEIVELVGFQVGIETPIGQYVVQLDTNSSLPASSAGIVVTLQDLFANRVPIRTAIVEVSTVPCGAILTGHIGANPPAAAFSRAKVVGLQIVLIPQEFLAACVTLDYDQSCATLLVWCSLPSSHARLLLNGANNIPQSPEEVKRGRGGRNAFRGQGSNRDSKTGPANREGRNMRDVGVGSTRNFRNSDLMLDSLEAMIADQHAYLLYLHKVRNEGGLLVDDAGEPLAIVRNPKGFKGAHFATFCEELIAPLIAAGSSEVGVCGTCGAPWVRVVERPDSGANSEAGYNKFEGQRNDGNRRGAGTSFSNNPRKRLASAPTTTGWQPSCACCKICDAYSQLHGEDGCKPYMPVPAVVLDPFAGAGTVGLVAGKMGRRSILIDLSETYCAMMVERLAQPSLLAAAT